MGASSKVAGACAGGYKKTGLFDRDGAAGCGGAVGFGSAVGAVAQWARAARSPAHALEATKKQGSLTETVPLVVAVPLAEAVL